MRLREFCLLLFPLVALSAIAPSAHAASFLLSSEGFAVLGGAGVTNAGAGVLGATVITGDLGGSTGTPAVTGFPPGTVNGAIWMLGAPIQAFLDFGTAYTTFGALPATPTAADLGGLTLFSGVYSVPAGTNLTGILKLDDGGVDGSLFIFLMESSLITAPGSSIDVSGLQPNDGIYWVVRSSATLGDNTTFAGNILANASITFNPGATNPCGRAFAQTGSVSFAGQNAVTLVENEVSIACEDVPTGVGSYGFIGRTAQASVPEPATFVLVGSILAGLWGLRLRRGKA